MNDTVGRIAFGPEKRDPFRGIPTYNPRPAPEPHAIEVYEKLAPRTASEEMHFDVVNPGVLHAILDERLLIAADVDAAKKGLFYGKDKHGQLGYWGHHKTPVRTGEEDKLRDQNHALHGIIGMDTEVAELIELFQSGELTREKVLDEGGDILWYFNLLLRHYGLTFEHLAIANMAKLAKRYPDGGFSLSQWEGRDKEAEAKEIAAKL